MRGVYPAEYGQMPEGDTSIGSIFSELNRKKLWIFLPTLLAFLGAAVFVNVVKPKYTGESKVLLENRDNYFTRPDKEQRGNDPPLDAEAVQSQVQTIMSRDIAKTAIKKLDLASREEFDPVKKETSALKRVLALLGVAKDPLQSSPEERILENYYDKLLVFNVGKSRVISIEFSSRDPDLAYRGANLIADEYISFQRDAKKSTTQGASAWLAQAMEPMRAKVAEAEARVEAFRSENGLLVGASNATIATQQLGEMNTQMSNARSTQTELQSKARMIREALRSGRIFETSEVVNNELVRRLLEQRVTMKTQIALEERSLLPGHPRMKELNAQLNDLEGQIRLAAERTARTMENDAKVAGARVQSIQAEFEGQKRTASSANEHEVQLRALEREARALRENYEQYLAKYRDSLSRDADAASPADARVISRAVMPQQATFPKKVPIILLATLATMVLTSAIIVTRFLFASDPAESGAMQPMSVPMASAPAEQPQAVAPVAAAVEPAAAPPPPPPRAMAAQRPPVATDPGEMLAPLVDDLSAMKPSGSALVIGCLGLGNDVVSTASGLPLGRQISKRGSTVYVDLTGAVADVEQATGRFRPAGISELVAGSASFVEAIHRDRASRMHIIPYGGRSGAALDPAGEDVRNVIEALVQTYDFVVIDGGAFSAMSERLASVSHAAVMVASHDDSDPAVLRAFQRLDAALPGCVTIVVEEPAIAAPRPANDRFAQANNVA